MLEPKLEHNLQEFIRLRRKQRWSIVVVPVIVVFSAMLASLLSLSDKALSVAILILLLADAAFIGWLEVRKTKTFMKDLREREGPGIAP